MCSLFHLDCLEINIINRMFISFITHEWIKMGVRARFPTFHPINQNIIWEEILWTYLHEKIITFSYGVGNFQLTFSYERLIKQVQRRCDEEFVSYRTFGNKEMVCFSSTERQNQHQFHPRGYMHLLITPGVTGFYGPNNYTLWKGIFLLIQGKKFTKRNRMIQFMFVLSLLSHTDFSFHIKFLFPNVVWLIDQSVSHYLIQCM